MAKNNFEDKKKLFAESLLSTPTKVTMQKVEPVENKGKPVGKKEISEQISAWIPSGLMESVRIKMIKDKKKLTPLLEELLTKYVHD